MSAILSGLNPQQLEAITLPHESALILAGAGSGKTRVLTTRIAHLIASNQTSPHGILAVTFTNKAAKEMLTRISAMLPVSTRGMWVGTFHGLCHRLLRTHFQEANLAQTFQILDVADQLSLIKRILKSLSVDDKRFPPRQVQWFVNNAKEAGLRASVVEADDAYTRQLIEYYLAYEQRCNKEQVVDFAELLLRCYELLSRHEILRTHYCARFSHILVDEFQDTNQLQYKWLKLLAGLDSEAPASVFVVGDDDQSIYAFRGADTGNMAAFERDFQAKRIIRLEQNYRSHGNILDAANALIENNGGRLGKNLWTAEEHGELIRIYQASSDIVEAEFIVDEIKSIHAEGLELSQVALLYRSNAQSRILEHGLFNAALPYRVYGGMRFYERLEIKHALAYLRLIANPDDDNALLRVVNFPARGIGPRSIEKLQDAAQQLGTSLWAAAVMQCGDEDDSLGISKKPKKGVAEFVRLIKQLQQRCEAQSLPVIAEQMLEHSGLVKHYQAERDGADRLENLHELINAATGFAHDAEQDGLTEFLAHATLEAGEHQAGDSQDALQLMTVHAAKGLEFHSVFLSGLEEGLFPHENSSQEEKGLEEERRLMYVAMTRARRRLYLSFAQSRMLHGQIRYNIASRFLDEIPEQLLKRLQPAENSYPAHFSSSPDKQMLNSFSTHSSSNKNGFGDASYLSQSSQWQAGQNVMHPKFGVGVVVSSEGSGSDARVQVNFEQVGMKWLLLEYAKLSAV